MIDDLNRSSSMCSILIAKEGLSSSSELLSPFAYISTNLLSWGGGSGIRGINTNSPLHISRSSLILSLSPFVGRAARCAALRHSNSCRLGAVFPSSNVVSTASARKNARHGTVVQNRKARFERGSAEEIFLHLLASAHLVFCVAATKI